MPTRTAAGTRTLTTTEAAVLALLAIEGERSGYDLLKLVSKAIAHVWSPARSQLYAVLARLERERLATRREVPGAGRPAKQLYKLTDEGRALLDAWLAEVVPGDRERLELKIFVGGLVPPEVLVAQVEQYRADAEARLEELRAIDATNTRQGNDRYHGYLLDLGIAHLLTSVRWAEAVLADLRR